MSSPSPLNLPGNGFSVWTQQPPASHAVQLVSSSAAAENADPPQSESQSAPASSGGLSSYPTYPEAASGGGGGGFVKWAALFLFLCALAAFLSSETKRKEVVEERDTLQVEKAELTVEKQTFHDNWVQEQGVTARLTDEIGGLETSLEQSRANVVQLTAEKNGLSKTIDELRGSLAMAIEDHKNTEASLQKVIKGLESKNAELTSTLQQEREKLQGLDMRLAQVMKELASAKEANEELSQENLGLRDKVAQLQSTLDKTVTDAQEREEHMRTQLEALQETNAALSASLEEQKAELSEVKAQLKASEEEVASEKEDDDNTQSQLNDLASQLQEAVAARDALNDEKQALADSVNELTERLNGSEISDDASTLELEQRIAELENAEVESEEQIETLESTRDELLQRNSQLQSSVEELNGHLSKLAEKEESEETALTERISQLTKANEALKKSLEAQQVEFKTLLQQAKSNTAISEPSASVETEALRGAVHDLKKTLGHSIAREASSQQEISDLLASHTDEILNLNTKMALATGELDAAKGLLSELDVLRDEVKSLRQQGEQLESELGQRAVHISTLAKENVSWQTETKKLRGLLESEHVAQKKLREFVHSLQERIDDLEKPAPQVAEK